MLKTRQKGAGVTTFDNYAIIHAGRENPQTGLGVDLKTKYYVNGYWAVSDIMSLVKFSTMSFNANFIKTYTHTSDNSDDTVTALNCDLDMCIHSNIYTTLGDYNAKAGNQRIKMITYVDL